MPVPITATDEKAPAMKVEISFPNGLEGTVEPQDVTGGRSSSSTGQRMPSSSTGSGQIHEDDVVRTVPIEVSYGACYRAEDVEIQIALAVDGCDPIWIRYTAECAGFKPVLKEMSVTTDSQSLMPDVVSYGEALEPYARGVEEKFEKYVGYLARCEGKFCTTTLFC